MVDDRGLEVPLVLRESTLLDINVHQVEASQPDWTLRLLGVGLVIALLIATGLLRGGAGLVGRIMAGLVAIALSVGGAVLLFLWLFTNHTMTAWNANVALFSPFALSIVILLLRPGGRVVPFLVRYAFAVAFAIGVVSFMPFAFQDNHELAALIVPPFFAAALLAMRLNRRRAAAPSLPT
jgi:hypothetical protein